jgi:hypothetical protein
MGKMREDKAGGYPHSPQVYPQKIMGNPLQTKGMQGIYPFLWRFYMILRKSKSVDRTTENLSLSAG